MKIPNSVEEQEIVYDSTQTYHGVLIVVVVHYYRPNAVRFGQPMIPPGGVLGNANFCYEYKA